MKTFPQVDPVTGMVVNIVELKHAMEVGVASSFFKSQGLYAL